MSSLSKSDIHKLFQELNHELANEDKHGEIYLVGGAVMCLVFDLRQSTRDLDAYFKPANEIRQAAKRVALRNGLDEDWLNDSVKGFLSTQGDFDDYLQLSNLVIFTARADYLLAMKCLAMRIGAEFHDLDDIPYLLRYLNIKSYKSACAILSAYYPLAQYPQKTLYALEEILAE